LQVLKAAARLLGWRVANNFAACRIKRDLAGAEQQPIC